MAGPIEGTMMDDFIRGDAGHAASDITFGGSLNRPDLPQEFATADLCIFPSLWENFPYACVEAMAAGRVAEGVDMLSAQNRVHSIPHRQERFQAIAAA